MSRVHSGQEAVIPGAPVFVFGSNLAGRHGKGAALWARQHRGAIYGQGIGKQGNSYAIPTKDERLRPLPLPMIRGFVGEFLMFAEKYWMHQYQVTPIGCGLAGFTPEQIAPFFRGAPDHVQLPPEFVSVLVATGDLITAGNEARQGGVNPK